MTFGMAATASLAASLQDFGFRSMLAGGRPAIGGRPLLVMMINFSYNAPLPWTNAEADTLVYPVNGKTLNSYFVEASNNRFRWTRPSTGIVGPIPIQATESEQRAKYLMDNPAGISRAMSAALMSATVDWARMDANGDGSITEDELGILILHNGAGSGARSVDPSGCLALPNSPVRICGGETRVSVAGAGLGTAAHELTHQLGAIDLYGAWNKGSCLNRSLTVMSCGPETLNLDPWHKLRLGWAEPRIRSLRAPSTETLSTALGDPIASIILYDPVRGTNEFLLLEYRTRNVNSSSGETELLSEGLAIWHVRQNPTYVAAVGAPLMVPGSNVLWGSGTMTLPLHWLDGTRTGIRIFIAPFEKNASSISISWSTDLSGIYNRNPFAGEGFAPIPGALAQVSVDGSDNAWGINNQDEIYQFHWGPRKWVQIPGRLNQIVAAGGTAWGLNAAHSIFRFNRQTGAFEQILGSLVQIVAGGENEAWGINEDFEIYRFNSASQRFEKVPGILRQVSGVSETNLWGLNPFNQAFQFDPVTRGFVSVPGSFTQIEAGNGTAVWGLNVDQQIFRYNHAIGRFDLIPGWLVQASVGFGDSVWGLNGRNEIFQFTGTGFAHINGRLRRVAAGSNTAWGLN